METPVKLTKWGPAITGNIKQNSLQGKILLHFIVRTLPRVQALLKYWEQQACNCSDAELRKQAIASLNTKAFHCQGGAVFAVPYSKWEPLMLRLIVAYQTMCDYLDNLCDRAGCTDGKAFLQLHQALIDALCPGQEQADYYKYYPVQDDGGYLNNLVNECRLCIGELPSYHAVHEEIMVLADYYIQLQVKKHIAPDKREKELKRWAEEHIKDYPGLLWQEFAAASGSTLALFALLGLATEKEIKKEYSENIVNTYLPWICGLHILLDYFIDRAEDRAGGDLNFTFYYADEEEMLNRLKLFVRESHKLACRLPASAFEKTVVEGLLAMYLSDKKVKEQGFKKIARDLMNESGPGAWKTYRLCSAVRKFL